MTDNFIRFINSLNASITDRIMKGYENYPSQQSPEFQRRDAISKLSAQRIHLAQDRANTIREIDKLDAMLRDAIDALRGGN